MGPIPRAAARHTREWQRAKCQGPGAAAGTPGDLTSRRGKDFSLAKTEQADALLEVSGHFFFLLRDRGGKHG